MTLLPVPANTKLDHTYVEHYITKYLYNDDVFCPTFLSGVLFYGPEKVTIYNNVRRCLQRHGNQWSDYMSISNYGYPLLPGPYVLAATKLWRISRLYADTANGFTVGLRRLSNGR